MGENQEFGPAIRLPGDDTELALPARTPEVEARRVDEGTRASRTSNLGPSSAPGASGLPAGPLKVGVLSSPGYRNQRGALDHVRRFLDGQPGVPHLQVKDPREVSQALDAMHRESLDVLAVNGGDGTLSMVLTGLLRRVGEEPPLLAVLAGGRTNMSAGDVGLKGAPVQQLERLLSWAQDVPRTGQLLRRHIIEVRRAPDEEPVYGLFFGAAALYSATLSTWHFQDECRVPGMHTGLGTATHVTKLVLAHLLRRSAFSPCRMQVILDGVKMPEQNWCFLFATTLQRMALGLHPWWGQESGPLHMMGIAQEHSHLLRAAVTGLSGRRSSHLVPERGYHSHNVQTMELQLEDGVTLDGEVILPRDGYPICVSAERVVGFVRP